MDDLDVRDLSRRIGQIFVSIVVGVVGALAITELLPETPRKETWMTCLGSGPDFARPYLVAAIACGLAIGIYLVLRALPRAVRRHALPKAILLR